MSEQKVCPKHPTPEMVQAGKAYVHCDPWLVWRDMWMAAPAPASVHGEADYAELLAVLAGYSDGHHRAAHRLTIRDTATEARTAITTLLAELAAAKRELEQAIEARDCLSTNNHDWLRDELAAMTQRAEAAERVMGELLLAMGRFSESDPETHFEHAWVNAQYHMDAIASAAGEEGQT